MSTALHDTQEIDILRKRLQETLARVPPSVAAASVQAVRDYKKRHKQAEKLLTKKSVTRSELSSAIQAVS